MQVTSGPDGFLATSDAADYSGQVLLTEYLRERQADSDTALVRALAQIRKQLSKRDQAALVRTIHRNGSPGSPSTKESWQSHAAGRGSCRSSAQRLYSPKLPFAAADLVAIVAATGASSALVVRTRRTPGHLRRSPRYPGRNSPSRCVLQAELKGDPGSKKFQNESSHQVAAQHVHMLLWHDENDALDPSRCWSEAVRGDCEHDRDRRADWKSLFRHIKGNAPAKPPRGG